MDVTTQLAYLTGDGPRLITAATRAGLAAPVPGLDWTVRDLVAHAGCMHRWATEIVTGGSREQARAARAAGPGHEPIDRWFADGHRALVTALAESPPHLDVWTFGPAPTPREFWIRRQVHELAIHRADAELAAGETPDFEDELAQDGIGEVLGFATERRFAIPRSATIGLDAADGPSWLITVGGERTEVHPSEDLVGTDVTVRGLSSDLYLWLWNRRSPAVVDGDEHVAALWTSTVRI